MLDFTKQDSLTDAVMTVVEKVEKIGCTECDEVNTKAAWKKNGGFCPSCKKSSKGVAEKVNEGHPLVNGSDISRSTVRKARISGSKINVKVQVDDAYMGKFDVGFTYDGKANRVTADSPMNAEAGWLITALLVQCGALDEYDVADYQIDVLG